MMTERIRLNDVYTLIEEIGSGGGGIVYKAYHERLETYVVVKQIRERVKGILESRAEADLLKNMKHTYLPRVYDFLELDGEIYTVMDYIPGMSLAEALRQYGRFDQKQVLKWAEQLAEAVAYLHNLKPPVIHSDIKPANIMLTPEGDICLIDFNISLAFDNSRRSSTGVSKGYSPPEQFRNQREYQIHAAVPKTETMETAGPEDDTVLMDTETEDMVTALLGRGVDERSDVYSLGAALYHLLTGEKPPVHFEEIIPISGWGVEINEGFACIIEKMMSINPDDRYQNGGQLLEAFRHIYELDSEYRNYRRNQRIKKAVLLAGWLAGVGCMAAGSLVVWRERNYEYNRLVEAAREGLELEENGQAAKLLEDAMALRPKRIEAYAVRAEGLYKDGRYEECIRYVKDQLNNPVYEVKTDEDKRSLGDLYYILGNAYMEEQDYINAAAILAQAVQYNQDNSLYYRDYAIAMAKNGNIKEAEAALRKASELNLGSDSIYVVQGEILLSEGNFEEAVGILKKAFSTAHTAELKRRASLLCSQAYQVMGPEWIDEELSFLEMVTRSFDGALPSMALSECLAEAYIRKGRLDKGEEDYYNQKALEIFQRLYKEGYAARQMMENITVLYQQTGQLELADHMAEELIEKFPERYEGYKRKAYLEADRQQEKENSERDYEGMKGYYDRASELYQSQGNGEDQEMEVLSTMISELEDGGWFDRRE